MRIKLGFARVLSELMEAVHRQVFGPHPELMMALGMCDGGSLGGS